MAHAVSLKFLGVPEATETALTRILQRKIVERCPTGISAAGGAFTVTFEIRSGIGTEGFRIEDGPENGIRITGNDPLGLLYGTGKFLRTAVYEEGGIRPGAWRGSSVPCKEVRGIYFATHFHNFYHDAPVEEIEDYVEDLALWGYNAVTVWFDMHHFKSIRDPGAVEMIGRLHAILNAAKRVGLKIGLLGLANEAYEGSPEGLRAEWKGGRWGYTHNMLSYHLELCPSNEEALKLLLEWRREVFGAFADLKLDYVWVWPHDQGGCSCEACAPWGGAGYLRASRPVAELAKEMFPDARIIVSTWFFDFCIDGEWRAFSSAVGKDSEWVDYIMAEQQDDCPNYMFREEMPAGLPLLGFPEISMHESLPWGGFGANPLPGRMLELWDRAGERLAGGFPYSEGIFEDINKVICGYLYWNGGGDTDEALREYIGYEYGPEVVKEVLEAIHLLEGTNSRYRSDDTGRELPVIPDENDIVQGEVRFVIRRPEEIERAYRLLSEVDGKLSGERKKAWRWRILYLRGLIDRELAGSGFRINERCNAALHELTGIFHVEDGDYVIKPPVRIQQAK